jgi:hypothetical protein
MSRAIRYFKKRRWGEIGEVIKFETGFFVHFNALAVVWILLAQGRRKMP